MSEEKKLKVYCETSFWSFLNGRPTPLAHIAVKQAATLQWWQEIAPQCEIYVSQYVNGETTRGNEIDAGKRADSMQGTLRLDGHVPEVLDLAEKLLKGHALPQNEVTDAAHIATASIYGLDVLFTWNCAHMANPVTLPKTAMIVGKEGYVCPVIITPAEFLERRGGISMTKSLNEMTELDFADPMDWVYEVRRRISEKYGHDIRRLFEAVGEEQREAEARGVKFVRLPIARRQSTKVV